MNRDRLGSVMYSAGARYYPYGEEAPVTAQDRDKFGTYHRDSGTGLDYAEQRYYAAGLGRFLTADPYLASGGTAEPGSWNRYSYVSGDPANVTDRCGLMEDDDCMWNGTTLTCPGNYPAGTDTCTRPSDPCHNQPTTGGGPLPGNSNAGGGPAPVTPPWEVQLNNLQYWTGIMKNKLTEGLPEECKHSVEECGGALATLNALEVPGKKPITAVGLTVALNQVVFKNGIGSTDLYMDLFPGKLAPSAGIAAMTIGQYFAANPDTSAVSALGGKTIYFRNGSQADGGLIMHELLHNLGLEDTDIQTALRIPGPSIEISRYLWDKCFKPPMFLLY